MALPRPSSPLAAWSDLKAFLSQQNRHKIAFAIISLLIPGLLILGFHVDSEVEPKAQIIYIQSWSADRTDAEIKAQQKIDQAKRDKEAAERQRKFQEIEKRLGI